MLRTMVLAGVALFSGSNLAHACVAPSGSEQPSISSTYQNAGLYAWNGSTWVLVFAFYDPYFESETMLSDDMYVSQSTFWGTGGDDGGGGSYMPHGAGDTSPSRGNGRGRGQGSNDPSISCSTPTMPQTTVVGHSLSYGGTLLQLAWRGQMLSNSHGSGVAVRPVQQALNNPNNPVPATCSSDAMTREAHAQEDGRYVRAQWLATGRGVPRAGQAFRVEFDDGGTEVYIWSGMSAPFSHALPGSLKCP